MVLTILKGLGAFPSRSCFFGAMCTLSGVSICFAAPLILLPPQLRRHSPTAACLHRATRKTVLGFDLDVLLHLNRMAGSPMI